MKNSWLKIEYTLYSKTRTQRPILLVLTWLLALPVIIVLLAGCNTQEETITGTVNMVGMDATKQLAAVTITVLSESDDLEATEEYLVANNDKGQELVDLDGAVVVATGKVKTN